MSIDAGTDRLIDHLVWGVRDLSAALTSFEDALGVKPAEGGRHIGRGTRNYLVALTNTAYLEIIALDEENPTPEGTATPFGLDTLKSDRVLTWAIHPDDIDAAAAICLRHGANHGPIAPMSRRDAAGVELSWRLASSPVRPLDGVAPFLIDWGASPHPAGSGIPSVELVDLRIAHPQNGAVQGLFTDLGIGLQVASGEPQIDVVLRGPGGELQL
ncbi:MAG: VOC family protein [Antricoccus sp.]